VRPGNFFTEFSLRTGTSNHTGYLAIVAVGLLLCVAIRFETQRQYLVSWQNHLSAQQNKAKDYSKKVDGFFTALNDNLGTLASLPGLRRSGEKEYGFSAQDRETIQQVFNNLAKNVSLANLYVSPSAAGGNELSGPQQPTLMLNKLVLQQRDLRSLQVSSGFSRTAGVPAALGQQADFLQIQEHLKWFNANYPDIGTVQSLTKPMFSQTEIIASDTANSTAPKNSTDKMALVFSVPYYDAGGKFGGCVSAVVFSNTLRNLVNDPNYTLISPSAEFMTSPVVRNPQIKMMLHAAHQTPLASTIFSEALVIDTHDVRGKWQLNVKYPVADYVSGQEFKAIRYFEYGSYAALALLTLAGLGWHRSNLKRAQDMRENAAALQEVNDNISVLNNELAENMKQLHAAQDEIIKKGKLAQMGQLVATVAHELRNPLSSVRTSAFLLRRKLADHPEKFDAQLHRIDSSVARCDAVITQFLDYAKSHKLEFTESKLDDWVANVIEEEAQKLPLAVAVECDLGLGDLRISFDQTRLSRAIINLLSNASEAMVGKGEDPNRFTCALPKIIIMTRLFSDRVELSVCDNGPGISDENLEKIMEPLFTTKNFGTGLGLPAVSQVMEQHGGGMNIKGGFGNGATFILWLPIPRKDPRAA
jgi:signal transduction histidine kinase